MRCGSCNEVFDGNAALLEPLAAALPAPASSPALLPESQPFDQKMAALDTRAAEVLGSEAADPIYTLELDTAMDAVVAAEAIEQADAPAAVEAEPLAEAGQPYDDGRYDDEAIAASPLALPAEPPSLPPAIEEALDLDLDVEPDAKPEPEPEPEPEPFDNALSIEALSDEELDAALEAELAVIEHDGVEPASEPDASPLAFTSMLADERREPTLEEAPAAANSAASLSEAERFNELEEVDEEALVQLSSAGLAEAQLQAVHAHALLPDEPAADEAPAAEDDAEEPGFIKRDRRRQKFGKATAIAMGLGSLLLLTTLAAQGLTTFRNQIAAALPPLKPALTAACSALGCKIELPAQIDDLGIEQGELQTLSETTFSFATQLRNQSATAQAWPHIELVLDDASDKAVLRRVFTPREYLGADVALDKGFAPHTEQSVKLYFELKQLKASGYHIAVFYP